METKIVDEPAVEFFGPESTSGRNAIDGTEHEKGAAEPFFELGKETGPRCRKFDVAFAVHVALEECTDEVCLKNGDIATSGFSEKHFEQGKRGKWCPIVFERSVAIKITSDSDSNFQFVNFTVGAQFGAVNIFDGEDLGVRRGIAVGPGFVFKEDLELGKK